ncbi:MAG: NAD(P)-dependent oxidoreductase, partial [Thaumarchaeota archaeon]
MKVGLIGLGIIGSRVAANLAEAGSLHTVYN